MKSEKVKYGQRPVSERSSLTRLALAGLLLPTSLGRIIREMEGVFFPYCEMEKSRMSNVSDEIISKVGQHARQFAEQAKALVQIVYLAKSQSM